MGYFSGLGGILGAAGDAKKKQQSFQPPPFDPNTRGPTEPPPFQPNLHAAGNPEEAGADDMMEMSEEPGDRGPPIGGIPGMPSQVPPGMTIGGLRESLRTHMPAGRSPRPFGGYYAPDGLEGMGGQLAELLTKIRGDAQKKYGGR